MTAGLVAGESAPERVVAALAGAGWAVVDDFLPRDEVRRLAADGLHRWRGGAFRRAGVGRGPSFRIRPEVRDDHVLWLEAEPASRAQRRFLGRMDALRGALNRELYLGLRGFEAHLAVFPPGARYRTHLDRFANAAHRIVSAIVYLNEGWSAGDGGALRLYLEEPDREPFEDVAPRAGRMVCFLSGRFHHEVLPARRERLSLTGWFTTGR